MPRIKLSPLPAYRFSCSYEVRVGDINYGGHLGNAELVSIIHDARVRFFAALGATEGNLGDGKTGVVMADLAVSYKGEVFLGDTVIVDCDIAELEAMSFRVFYRVTRNGTQVALAETGIVGYDYGSRAIAPIPAIFRDALA